MHKRSRILAFFQIALRLSEKYSQWALRALRQQRHVSSAWAITFVLLLSVACTPAQPAQSPAEFSCPEQQVKQGNFCVAQETPESSEIASASQVENEKTRPHSEAENKEHQTQEETPSEMEEAEQDESPECSEEKALQGLEAPECSAALSDNQTTALPLSLASSVDISMAAQAGPIVQHLAAAYLPPGARSLGVPFAAQFIAGQVLVQEVQLEKGRCYTVVAVGLPPVSEVNLYLYAGSAELTSDLDQESRLAVDDIAGPQAVLGPRSSCFSPEQTAVFQLVMEVQSGQGVAAGQVFKK